MEIDMSGVGIISAIIIGIVAGWIAERVSNRRHGLFTNLIVGLAGALLGGFAAGMLGLQFTGFWPSLLVSTIGAIVLLAILNLFRGRRAL
jgi:uncharacterized membrane protein YeaQ/YmgE (transglycosylase-associated protein family)